MSEESEYWERYYEVTAERPAWGTVCRAIELFAAEDAAAGPGARASGTTPRLAVDLGCGGGRDARQLLRAGWRVVAVDREAGSGQALEKYVEPETRDRLEIVTADLADVEVPACDLVNASLSLPFLEPGPSRERGHGSSLPWRREPASPRCSSETATVPHPSPA